MTTWSENLPEENGYYWIWTGTRLEISTLEVHPEGPSKILTTCSGVQIPIFGNRLFDGWLIGSKIEEPEFPEDCQC